MLGICFWFVCLLCGLIDWIVDVLIFSSVVLCLLFVVCWCIVYICVGYSDALCVCVCVLFVVCAMLYLVFGLLLVCHLCVLFPCDRVGVW